MANLAGYDLSPIQEFHQLWYLNTLILILEDLLL